MPKLSFCMPCYDTNVKVFFATSLLNTEWPEGYARLFLKSMGMWTPKAFNLMVKSSRKWGADFIVIASVDVGWQPDTIKRLIGHNLPVVGGWANGRCHPFICHVATAIKHGDGLPTFQVVEHPEQRKGLERIAANGSELVVYRKDVFDKIPEPWFFGPEMMSNDSMSTEDYFFATQAEKYGVEMWVDWGCPLIHHVEGLTTLRGVVTAP